VKATYVNRGPRSIGRTPGCWRTTRISGSFAGSVRTVQFDHARRADGGATTGHATDGPAASSVGSPGTPGRDSCCEGAARELYETGCALALAGDTEAAIDQFGRASRLAVAVPRLLADIAVVAGQAIGWHRSPIEALGSLQTAATYAPDASTAAVCLAHASMFATLAGDVAHALELARRAVEVAPASDPVATLVGTAVHGWQLLLVGDPQAPIVLGPLVQLAPLAAATGGPDVLTLVQLVALFLVITERWDQAADLLETVQARAGPAGWRAASSFSAATLALLQWRRGEWTAAYRSASAGVDDAVGGDIARAWAQSFLAQITAALGRTGETRTLARSAIEVADRTGAAAAGLAARAALAHLELSQRHVEPALGHLDSLARRVAATGMVEPGYLWWEGDYLEALALSGRRNDLELAITSLQVAADRSGRLWAKGVVARARGMQATGAVAEQWFDLALAFHDELGVPFERARTLLRRGESRLVRGCTARARRDLAAAHDAFAQLGALEWAAAAERRHTHRSDTSESIRRLTAAEQRVAEAAASGQQNREIADALYLSTKTVDHHLQAIYRKLGIRSRTELTVVLMSRETNTD
jgi:DNA-binding CsgD family transcriptional regulator